MSVYRKSFCKKPGRGYYCTYAEHHRAECDIWPEWYLGLWWQVEDMFSFVKKKVFVNSVRKMRRR